MAEVELLRSLPKGGKRNVKARASAKTDEHIAISREYGEMYFDGPREYGYGGYGYDGRWVPVAKDIVEHFDLKPGDRVLDVRQGELCWVAGTVYMEMALKPDILEDVSKDVSSLPLLDSED